MSQDISALSAVAASGLNAAQGNVSVPKLAASAGTSRSHEMESAMYFADTTSARSLQAHHMSSQQLKNDNLMASVAKAEHDCANMRRELLESASREAALVQKALSMRVNEEMLNERVHDEVKSRHGLVTQIKGMQGELEALKLKCNDASRRDMGCSKSMAVLEINISDLQKQLQQTISSERKVTQRSTDSLRSSRTLERELMDLRLQNQRICDDIEKMQRTAHHMSQEKELHKDRLLRDLQQHQIKGISLQHELDEKTVFKEQVEQDMAMHVRRREALAEEMRVNLVLINKDRQEYEKRLEEEEDANNAMVEEIAKKAMSLQMMEIEAKSATESRDMLQAQVDDKHALTLELGKRLHSMQMHYGEVERHLEDVTAMHEGATKALESSRADINILQARLEKEQSNTRAMVKWHNREASCGEDLDDKCNQLKTNDTEHTLRYKQAIADKAALRERLENKSMGGDSVREQVHDAHAVMNSLEEKTREASEELTGMTLRYEKKSAIVGNQVRELKELNREWNESKSRNSVTLNKMHADDEELNDELRRQQGQMDKSNKQLTDLHELLQETTDKNNGLKEKVMAQVTELKAANDELSEELNAQMKRNGLMQNDLLNSERRIKGVQAQMAKNDFTAQKMKEINSEEQTMLQTKLDQESLHLDKLGLDVQNSALSLRGLKTEFENCVRSKRMLQKQLREEKFDEERMSATLEAKKEPEMENDVAIQELENARNIAQTRLQERLDAIDALRSRLNSMQAEEKELRKELRDGELKEAAFFSAQVIDKKSITELGHELKTQEEIHLGDARKVRTKISQLQDALQEKVNTVDHLTKATQAMKAKAKQLQVRLEQTEAEAAQAQTAFEAMLDKEQSLAADMRSVMEAKARDVMTLRATLLGRQEKIMTMKSVLTEKLAQTDSLNRDAFALSQQAHEAQMKVEAISIRERDHFDRITDFEEEVVELKLQMRERSHVESDLKKNLVSITNENEQMRRQIQEKTKAERILLAELDAKRLHVGTDAHLKTAGAAKASAQAEREFETLLHEMNDDI
jgi:chromosome segregation ATPase